MRSERRPTIAVGQSFSVKWGDRVDEFVRETDDPSPVFECERIRVTHLSCSDAPAMRPYTFGAEPEWFRRRGFEPAEVQS